MHFVFFIDQCIWKLVSGSRHSSIKGHLIRLRWSFWHIRSVSLGRTGSLGSIASLKLQIILFKSECISKLKSRNKWYILIWLQCASGILLCSNKMYEAFIQTKLFHLCALKLNTGQFIHESPTECAPSMFALSQSIWLKRMAWMKRGLHLFFDKKFHSS